MDYRTRLLAALLLLGFLHQGYTLPDRTPQEEYPEDEYNDTYDYEDAKSEESNDVAKDENIHTDPPRFDKDEITISAKAGEDVLLPCDVINKNKNNVILWYNETRAIVQNTIVLTQKRIQIGPNNSIRISRLTPYDTSVYMCEVLPDQVQFKVNLTVKDDTSIHITLNDQVVSERQLTYHEGEPIVLECKLGGDHSNAKIKWSLNSESIHQTGAHLENNKIIIEKITARHAGTYRCLGDIPGKEKDLPITWVDIVVQYEPKTSTHRHYTNANLGHSAELHCDYHANPIASVEWKHRGQSIPMISNKYKITNSPHNRFNRTSLIVKNVEKETDLGMYTCEAKNSLGSHVSKVHIILEPETPVYEKHDVDGRIIDVYWLCRSTTPLSDATLHYRLNKKTDWMTEAAISTKTHEAHKSHWKIHHKLEVPTGEWEARVRVKNAYGWSEYSKIFKFVINDEEIVVTETTPNDASEAEDDVVKAGFGGGNAAPSTYTVMPFIVLASTLLSIHNLVPSLLRSL